MCYVYNSGEPGWYESGEREATSVVSGHARAAVETVVDVPDHGDALSPDREETIKINNKVQVYQVRSLDRPLFIVFAQNSEGIIVTSQTREQGMRECAVKFVAVLRVRDQEESTLS